MAIIQVDGQQYEAKVCGRGKFSKVYRVGDRVVYYTRGDCSKEVLAQFQHNRMMHLPEIIRHDSINDRGNMWYVFSSPVYRDVTKKDRSAWNMMKATQRSADRYKQALYLRGERGIYLMQEQVNGMKEDNVVPKSVIKALQEIVDVVSNCGDKVLFDLHNKNFGVNQYGVLIFRDPVYIQE